MSIGTLAENPRTKAATSRRWHVPWPLLIIAVLLSVAWFGPRRADLGPAAGSHLHGESMLTGEVSEKRFRVATFNIHRGKGTDDRFDLQRTAKTLETIGAQLVCLNEVSGGGIWKSENQAERLGELLKQAWLFTPAEQRWWHVRFGNALLSSMPVVGWQQIPLVRGPGKSPRNAVLTIATHQGRRINVLLTHIDRSDDRARAAQLRTVAELFLSLEEPAILMGDMNSRRTDPEIKRLLKHPGVKDPFEQKYGSQTPPSIDWILVRGLKCLDAGMVDRGASDHPMLWAELEFVEP